MTLRESSGPIQFEVQSPPAGGLEETKFWAYEQMSRLVYLMQNPMIQSAIFVRVEDTADPVFIRPADGMLIQANVNVVGAGKPAGFYVYVGGAWKQLQTI